MTFFINNGKCRTLPCTSLASLGQELKEFLKKKNPDIKGFLPSGVLKGKFSRWLDFTGSTLPFTVVAVVRTRKGFRLATASFTPEGALLNFRVPPETNKVKERILAWENYFKSAFNNPKQKYKAVRVRLLQQGL